jgi:hypothetical protein
MVIENRPHRAALGIGNGARLGLAVAVATRRITPVTRPPNWPTGPAVSFPAG